MDETPKTLPAQWTLWGPKKWVALIISGLVLGEAVWMAIVSLTRDVILPLMAMAMGEETASSPLSLGKQDFNFPDLFTAVLQLCLAGIFVIILNAWIQKKPKYGKTKSLSLAQPVAPTATAKFKSPVMTQASAASQPPASSTLSFSRPLVPRNAPAGFAASQPDLSAKPEPVPPAAVAPSKPRIPSTSAPARPKPEKAHEPKEVFYNSVGERITPLDDDENVG